MDEWHQVWHEMDEMFVLSISVTWFCFAFYSKLKSHKFPTVLAKDIFSRMFSRNAELSIIYGKLANYQ